MEPPSKPQQIVDRADEGWRFSPQKYQMGKLSRLTSEILSQIVWHLKLEDLLSFSRTCKGSSELARCYIFYNIKLLVPTKRMDLMTWFAGKGEDNKGLRGCVHQLEVVHSPFYNQKGFQIQKSNGTYDAGQGIVTNQSQYYSDLISKLPNLISLKWRTVFSTISISVLKSIQFSKIKYLQISGFSLPKEPIEGITFNGLVSLVLSDVHNPNQMAPFIKGILESSHNTLEYFHFSQHAHGHFGATLDFDLKEEITFPKLRTFHSSVSFNANVLDALVPSTTRIVDFSLHACNAIVLDWFKQKNGWDELKKVRLLNVSTAPEHISTFLMGSPNIEVLIMEDYFTLEQMGKIVYSVASLKNLETLKVLFSDFDEITAFPNLKNLKKLWIGTENRWEVDHTRISEMLGHLDLTHIVMEGDILTQDVPVNPRYANVNRYGRRGLRDQMSEERKLELLRSAVTYHCETWKNLEFAYFGRYPMKVIKDEGVLLGVNPQEKGISPELKQVFGYPNYQTQETQA
eukprot:TRINITY_DN4333_c0_g1_i1.p1 TRINITY_DN4333_c0_g1~~TRINITY_DN4333_c0_g1_i1.p1  ORF type:complete len:515 (+),score=158.91 TRINITY_DN4333_c0_g1_i1:159-1703(+)